MTVRFCKVNEKNLKICITNKVWGREIIGFKDWKIGDIIIFTNEKKISALAVVSGNPFKSDLMIFEDRLYQHRIPIEFNRIIPEILRKPYSQLILDCFEEEWGSPYGWGIMKQHAINGKNADKIYSEITNNY